MDEFTSELGTEELGAMQQFSPQQLHLWDSSDVLQQTNQISADDHTLHELHTENFVSPLGLMHRIPACTLPPP